MNQIAVRIQLFHRLYLTCMGGTIFFLLISVVLFVKYDMSSVFAYYTKRQETREIKKIKERGFVNDSKRTEVKTAVLRSCPVSFRVEREVIFVHTEEVIE